MEVTKIRATYSDTPHTFMAPVREPTMGGDSNSFVRPPKPKNDCARAAFMPNSTHLGAQQVEMKATHYDHQYHPGRNTT